MASKAKVLFFSSPILHVSAVKGCHLHGKFVYFEPGMHVRAISDVINHGILCSMTAFWYLIDKSKN